MELHDRVNSVDLAMRMIGAGIYHVL